MTQNQIANKQAEETARNNKEREKNDRASAAAHVMTAQAKVEEVREKKRQNRFDNARKIGQDMVGTYKDWRNNIMEPIKNFQSHVASMRERTRNDVAWYSKNSQSLKDFASFPWGVPLGTDTNALGFQTTGAYDLNAVPGIYALEWAPCFSDTERANSDLNIATQELYTFVRHANSGSRTYDAADLGIYVLAVDSIVALTSWCARAFGVAKYWRMKNSYVASSLLRIMGIDPDDFSANMANYRGRLNYLIDQLKSFAIPYDLALFKRHAFMSNGIYRDLDNDKAQIYLYNLVAIYQFGLDANGAGTLNHVQLNNRSTPNAFSTYLDVLDNAIGAMFSDEDRGTISGDLMKAYGSKLIEMPPVDENYSVEPVVDVLVLEQMHNTTIVPNYTGTNLQIPVTQSNNILTCAATFLGTGASRPQPFLLDKVVVTDFDSPDEKVTIEITRNCPGILPSVKTAGQYVINTMSEIFVGDSVLYKDRGGVDHVIVRNSMVVPAASNTVNLLGDSVRRSFYYAAQIYQWIDVGSSTSPIYIYAPSFDIDNYVVLTQSNFANMNRAALRSLLWSPSFANASAYKS